MYWIWHECIISTERCKWYNKMNLYMLKRDGNFPICKWIYMLIIIALYCHRIAYTQFTNTYSMCTHFVLLFMERLFFFLRSMFKWTPNPTTVYLIHQKFKLKKVTKICEVSRMYYEVYRKYIQFVFVSILQAIFVFFTLIIHGIHVQILWTI